MEQYKKANKSQLITAIKKAILKHGYLLITAAWLYTLSFIISNYWSYNSSPQKVKDKLESRIKEYEKTFNNLANDTALVATLIDDKNIPQSKLQLTKEPFGIFAYTVNDVNHPILSFWNSNLYAIEQNDIQKPDSSYYVKYQNGSFELIIKSIQKSNQIIKLAALIPIEWDFFTETKYLHKDFANFPQLDQQYEISDDKNAIPIVNSLGNELFKIKQKGDAGPDSYDWLTIILRTCSIIFLFIFFNALAIDAIPIIGFNKTFGFLCTITLFIRIVTYISSFPFNRNRLGLFDPLVYASRGFHSSLGDLFINVVLLFWLSRVYKFNTLVGPQAERLNNRKFQPHVNIVLLTLTAFFCGDIIRGLVQDSTISFEVTNFFSLNIYSVVSFIILCFLMLCFYNVSHILLGIVLKRKLSIYVQLFIIAVTGLLVLSFKIGSPTTIPNIAILLWLIIYVLLVNIRKKDVFTGLLSSSFFIFWIMFFAASTSAFIVYQNRAVELEERKVIAERLALKIDPSGEILLSIAITNLSDSFLTNNYPRLNNEYINKFLKDSIINENFSGYLNKYETKIYTFDGLQKPLFNEDSTSFPLIQATIINQGKLTDIPGLLLYENNVDKFSYLYEKVIKKTDSTLGYMYVIVRPKRYKSEALFPELFKQVSDLTSDFNTNYAYAVYNNKKLINHFNDYPFADSLIYNRVRFKGYKQINTTDFNELWYDAGNGKTVVLVKKNSISLESVTLFAYLFGAFLIVIATINASIFLLRTRFRLQGFKQMFSFNLRSQIQATILFISVFSFLVIGVATISFFIYRINESNQTRLNKSIQVMAGEIETKVAQFIFDDILTVKDIGVVGDVERKINEISETHNVDVNFFDAAGNLKISTQPYIYNKNLLSKKMDPRAFYALSNNLNISHVQEEHIGDFTYLSIYVPMHDANTGKINAYLNIPYLNSESELNQEISGFLATLINLNAFIFLIAGAIAFTITNRITASFNLISNKMRDINLGKVNEEIEWHRKDEIGALVSEYNKMVRKLDNSAKSLAQNEREGAWREMARQVAHEIKNPLTPMKLSIQYLQRAIDNDSDNVKQLSQQVAKTLVEQIDQLSKIAGDFSQFANIGNTTIELFDLNEIIASLVQLYQAHENLSIHWNKQDGNYQINADKTQISRLFSNLLKNAVEASHEDGQINIVINQKINNGLAEIAITDNGTGIPNDMKDKIFKPNFTTKSSGTGLGLAICHGIVEKANGHIWFDTIPNKQTTFFVQLPLA